MSMPKFEVGEVVILQSVDYPEFNGEYSVKAVLKPGQQYMGKVVSGSGLDDWYYDLGFQTKMFKTFTCWRETTLRKKQEPSGMRYNELIKLLNSPIPMPCNVE